MKGFKLHKYGLFVSFLIQIIEFCNSCFYLEMGAGPGPIACISTGDQVLETLSFEKVKGGNYIGPESW